VSRDVFRFAACVSWCGEPSWNASYGDGLQGRGVAEEEGEGSSPWEAEEEEQEEQGPLEGEPVENVPLGPSEAALYAGSYYYVT
jgi:hypothetical protein